MHTSLPCQFLNNTFYVLQLTALTIRHSSRLIDILRRHPTFLQQRSPRDEL